jgi:adenosylcobinamide-GDP ribazoletransferase
MKTVLTAVVFLTRVPLAFDATADDVSRGARWFPLVGALLGVASAVIAYALTYVPQLPPMIGALIVVAMGTWWTGAIHLDGLADAADGLGGGQTPDEILRIMRDPRLGTFGVLALILVIGAKVGAIATLWERQVLIPVLISTATLSRWTPVVLGAWLPYARPDGGIGKAVVRQGDVSSVAVAGGITAGVAWWALGTGAFLQGALTLAVTCGVGRTARRRIGGVTGDIFGACVELTEAALLLSAVVVTEET